MKIIGEKRFITSGALTQNNRRIRNSSFNISRKGNTKNNYLNSNLYKRIWRKNEGKCLREEGKEEECNMI